MGDGYGPRTPTQRLWLAGAVALVAVLLVGGGWLSWRGLSRHTPNLSESSGATSDGTGERVVFGAPEIVDGVPWGFPLTPLGAAAAGVMAVAVTGQPEVVFDPRRFGEVADVVFTPDQAAAQSRQVDAARTEFELSGWGQQPPSRRTYFFTPLGVRLVSYDPGGPSARVEVWAMTMVGVGDVGGAVFTTSTVDLVANDDAGTWVVAALDSQEGPTPMVGAVASAPGRTRALLRDALPIVPLPLPVAGAWEGA
ncbi:MAG: hypothetical protein M3N57_12210 [Actinomycetota bacterium]|nr:hypothetical protein [Actinomycetota bacterium]